MRPKEAQIQRGKYQKTSENDAQRTQYDIIESIWAEAIKPLNKDSRKLQAHS